jgi:hypothetical protein
MHDTFGVGGLQCVRHLNPYVQHVFGLQRHAADSVFERLALHQLHHDKRPALVLADIVNRADIGVIQRRGGAGLALKAFQRLLVSGVIIGKELQSDKPAEPRIFGFEDHTHAAASELFEHVVVGNGPAGHALTLCLSTFQKSTPARPVEHPGVFNRPYAEVSEFLGHGLLNILKSRSLQSGSDTPSSGLLVCFFGIGRLSGRSLGKLSRQLIH